MPDQVRAKDAHDLHLIIEHRLEHNRGKCYISPNQLKEYSLPESELGAWAREHKYEIQPPLFAGGLYVVERAE